MNSYSRMSKPLSPSPPSSSITTIRESLDFIFCRRNGSHPRATATASTRHTTRTGPRSARTGSPSPVPIPPSTAPAAATAHGHDSSTPFYRIPSTMPPFYTLPCSLHPDPALELSPLNYSWKSAVFSLSFWTYSHPTQVQQQQQQQMMQQQGVQYLTMAQGTEGGAPSLAGPNGQQVIPLPLPPSSFLFHFLPLFFLCYPLFVYVSHPSLLPFKTLHHPY